VNHVSGLDSLVSASTTATATATAAATAAVPAPTPAPAPAAPAPVSGGALLLPGDAPWTPLFGGLALVLKQVHPETGITLEAARVVADAVEDLIARVAASVAAAAAVAGTRDVSSRDVQTAVRLVLPGLLARHAVSEGTKAVTKFCSGDAPAASARAGLQFSVSAAAAALARALPGRNIMGAAPVYLAAVCEYVTAEVLELSGNAAHDARQALISTRHVLLGVKGDEELDALFRDAVFPVSAGVVPGVHESLAEPPGGNVFDDGDALFGAIADGEELPAARPRALAEAREAGDHTSAADDLDHETGGDGCGDYYADAEEEPGRSSRAYAASRAAGRAMLAVAAGRSAAEADAADLAALAEEEYAPIALPLLLAGARAAALVNDAPMRVARPAAYGAPLDAAGAPLPAPAPAPGVALGDALLAAEMDERDDAPAWSRRGDGAGERPGFGEGDFEAAVEAGGAAAGAALLAEAAAAAAPLASALFADVAAHARGGARVAALVAEAAERAGEGDFETFRASRADEEHAAELADAFARVHLEAAAEALAGVDAEAAAAARAALARADAPAAALAAALRNAKTPAAKAAARATARAALLDDAARLALTDAMLRADEAVARAVLAAPAPGDDDDFADDDSAECPVTGNGSLRARAARAVAALDARLAPGAAPAFDAAGRAALTHARAELAALAAARAAAGAAEPTAAEHAALLHAYSAAARAFAQSGDAEADARAEYFFDRLGLAQIRAAQGGGHVGEAWGLRARPARADAGGLLPLPAFATLVAELGQQFKTDIVFSPEAVAALAAAAEDHLVGVLGDTNRAAIGRGAQMVEPKDVQLARRVRGERG